MSSYIVGIASSDQYQPNPTTDNWLMSYVADLKKIA
jgi:hypothetical protein